MEESLCLLQGRRNPAEKRWGWVCIDQDRFELLLL